MALCFLRWLWGAFTTKKRCAGEIAQARYCKSTAVHFSSGSYRPLGGDPPAPKRTDARDPTGTAQSAPTPATNAVPAGSVAHKAHAAGAQQGTLVWERG